MIFEVFQESFPPGLENSFIRTKINVQIHSFYFTFHGSIAFKKDSRRKKKKKRDFLISYILNEQECTLKQNYSMYIFLLQNM